MKKRIKKKISKAASLMGKKGGKANKDKNGKKKSYWQNLQKLGVEARLKKHEQD